ncbi:MAG: glycosyltransferase [Candidatus Diapherotrites archaeon]|uniref:Glycosyltransferase n=1 Tax=Candidatus Iainarchaeum sp. TaxID=3101447 RepID=A0A939C7N4_9ARCH|nr:glycosyltransferase [Candidatus Diapherotrites archaeon]
MISVIVPAYNEEKTIAACLKSVLSQGIPRQEYEVIVSDSSSTDKTVQVAEKYADKVLKCKKVSAGYGRNHGAKKAKGNILAFIDADSIAGPNWLEGIKEEFEKEGIVAATGPFRALEKDSLLERLFYSGWSIEARVTTMVGFPLLAGFNIAVQKSAFEKAGCFNEENMTCEDYDLSLKLKKLGKIGFNNKIFTLTSTRNIREGGIIKYSIEGLSYLLFKKKSGWEKRRRDW